MDFEDQEPVPLPPAAHSPPRHPNPDDTMVNMSTFMSVAEQDSLLRSLQPDTKEFDDGYGDDEEFNHKVELISVELDEHDISNILDDFKPKVPDNPPVYPHSAFVSTAKDVDPAHGHLRRSGNHGATTENTKVDSWKKIVDPRLKDCLHNDHIPSFKHENIKPIMNSTRFLEMEIQKLRADSLKPKVLESKIPHAISMAKKAASNVITSNHGNKENVFNPSRIPKPSTLITSTTAKNIVVLPESNAVAVPRAKITISEHWKSAQQKCKPNLADFVIPKWELDVSTINSNNLPLGASSRLEVESVPLVCSHDSHFMDIGKIQVFDAPVFLKTLT